MTTTGNAPAVDGQTYRSHQQPHGRLVVEPTDRTDATVGLWAYVGGEEQRSVKLLPAPLRALAADLAARADLLDPPAADPPTATPGGGRTVVGEVDPALLDAVADLADRFGDPDTADHLGGQATCTEVDTVAAVLAFAGHRAAAARWVAWHADYDEQGDNHTNLGPTTGFNTPADYAAARSWVDQRWPEPT